MLPMKFGVFPGQSGHERCYFKKGAISLFGLFPILFSKASNMSNVETSEDLEVS
jgi:hypothetical protein